MPAEIEDMVWVPGGTFWMGSDQHYPDEAPVRQVRIDPFRIERTPVSNSQFARFVRETGYVTLAERSPDQSLYPDAPAEALRAGSAVFSPPDHPVELRDPSQWWSFVPGANWRLPQGPAFPAARADHPVVHVAYADALAYARWKGSELPSEAQWEHAARGSLDRKTYAWGDDFMPDGRPMANTWQGRFPDRRLDADFERTSPIGSFPPNGFGLLDMIGNVWEWTSDYYAVVHTRTSCCIPHNPRVEDAAASRLTSAGVSAFPRRVLKGGSHLCAPNYCSRYRPAARHPHEEDTSTSHIGFRCVAPSD